MLLPFKNAAPSAPEDPAVAVPAARARTRAFRLVAALLLPAAATAATLLYLRGREGGVRYVAVPATEGPLVARVTANGTISARVTVQVGSQVSGRIQEILVDFNS